MNLTTNSLIGSGIAHPLNTSNTGGLSYKEGIERINQSLFILFETPKGSRLNLPEFGSDIHKYRFDPLDKVLLERIRFTITEDIRRWEPRITNTSIEFLTENEFIDRSILYISITYSIINTTVRANYVYPYKMSSYDTLDTSYN